MPKPKTTLLYVLTAHAKQVMIEREIALEWVLKIIEHPTLFLQDRTDPAITHALGRIYDAGDRVLRVVYNHQQVPIRIVTVYFDRTMKDKL